MREFRIVELLVPPSPEEMDRCFRGELDADGLFLFKLRLSLHPGAARRFRRLKRLGEVLERLGRDAEPDRAISRRSFWRSYALPAGAFAVLVLVCWTAIQLLWPIRTDKVEDQASRWSLGQVPLGQIAHACTGELAAALRQVSQALGPSGLAQTTRGIPLVDSNTRLRAYPQPDGRTLIVVVRDTLVDGFLLDLSRDSAREAEHWSLDLWDDAQELVGTEGAQLARDYFVRQDEKHDEQRGQGDWSVYSPGYHALLHDPLDIDGDGAEEYPVSLQGTLFFLAADGQLRQSWATRQGLAGWIYDELQSADLDGDGAVEIVLSLAAAHYIPEYPQLSSRAIAVYSVDGEELAPPLEWPNYVKLEGLADFTGQGRTELLISTDLPGNPGYEVKATYKGESITLRDQDGGLALIGFAGVEPYIEWLPDKQVLSPEPSTVLQVLRPMGQDRLHVFLYHHPPAERYGVFYEFVPAERQFTRLGRLAESLLGVPAQQPALVSAGDRMLTLMQRPPELQLVNERFTPLAGEPLPGPDPTRSANLATLFDSRGVLLAFAWPTAPEEQNVEPTARPASSSISAAPQPMAELLAYEIRDGCINTLTSAGFDRPVWLVLPLAADVGRVPLLVLTDEAELWELASALPWR